MIDTNNDNLWALYYETDAYTVSGERIMGRQAAGNALLKAYAKSSLDKIGVYARTDKSLTDFTNNLRSLLPNDRHKDVVQIPWGNPKESEMFGGIYYPAPDIDGLANQRFFFGHDNYSIVGITHTTASESVIKSLISCYTSPLMEWDAIICTSNSVKNSFNVIYDQYHAILSDRIGATRKPQFSLPIIPLGVHTDDYSFSKTDKAEGRKSLNIDDEDIVLLFLGRISFHAKAHHVPMYLALEEASKKLGKNKKIHLIQTGWFPNDHVQKLYEDDAKRISPSINFHYLDGRDKRDKLKSFAISDIFISLVDNYQETFGLTPLEAMASKLPVIVSDWNGYKDTVRHEIDGFRIRSSSMEPGHGYVNALRHNLTYDTYDHYIGRTSQTVALDINQIIDTIILLSNNKELRKELGENGRKRSLEFDWLKVLDLYKDLKENLEEKREFSKKEKKKSFLPPITIQDQYTFFSDYPTEQINNETFIELNNAINNIDLAEFTSFGSISFIDGIVPSIDFLKKSIAYIDNNNGCKVENLINHLEINATEVFRVVLWLSKYGYVEIKQKNG